MEEEHFDKLPVEERCAHKSWKARISGYTSLLSILDDIPGEKNDEWNKYVPTVKNILLENNDPALEKGLEVVLHFVSKAAVAAKIAGHIVAGLVKKCVVSSRVRTRDLALQICLACIEIEQQTVITNELLKGAESKNPKISVGCIHILTEIIKNFGTTIIPVEGIIQKLPVLLEDKDQNVRNEAKSLTIELYRWLRNDLRTNLLKPEILKPQKLAEIVSEIAKIKDCSAVPTRFLRSQQKVQQVEILEIPEVDDLVGNENAGGQSVESSEREPLNNITPVDIISRIPEEFNTQVRSAKWLDRKEALENLEKILMDAGKIQNGDFHDIINTLVNLISKDANITAVCLAVRCVTHLARKLGEGFSQYGLVVFRPLLEKLKERKPSVVQTLREALDSVSKSSTFDLFVDDLSESLRNKNPNVKSEGALFLSRFFSRLSPTSLNRKSLKPLFPALVTCLSDQDPCVREQSAKALGVAMGVLGEEGLSPVLNDLEKTKLSKIKECAVSFLAETDNLKLRIPNLKKGMECSNFNYPLKKPLEQLNEKKIPEAPKIKKILDNTMLKSEYKSKQSIADFISEATIKALSDKDWSTRIQAISEIQEIVKSTPDFSADLGELGPLLHSRMLESNPKISSASINLVTSLAEKIGPPFKDQFRIVLPALLKAIGDVKGPVRDVAVSGLTKMGENCGYGEIFRSEFLSESLKSGSNTAKTKLWRWVAENLPKITTKEVPKYELENILPSLFTSLEDKNAHVRSEASNAVESFLKVLTLGTIMSFCEKFYGKVNNDIIKIILGKHKSGSFPEVPDTPSKLPAKSKSKSIRTTSPVVSRKKVTFANDGEKMPLLAVNNLKNQRVIDEHKHKTAKWEFATPRTEFVDLLKGLMSAANFSSELTKLMYHTDFRCHIKAMDLLIEEIAQNSVGIVCNLDLILRWLTLRFFDGNPAVLSKSLDFVIAALGYLKETNYCLLDSEAAAFVPYLVMKLGDSKENIQTKVKEILVNLTSVYPVSKLKKFVMDGARSNIGRQRANCLDVIASYINVYGDSVYLKEIDSVAEAVGKLLKDRDPGIKKKAFLVAGMLYDREGEKIMKFIEKYAGEDFHVIEDRIRKYVISKPNTPQKQFKTSDTGSFHSEVTSSQSQILSAECRPQISGDFPEPEPEPEPKNEVPDDTCQKQPGTFHWDADLVQETDDSSNMVIHPSAEIVDIDLEFMKDHPVSFDRLSERPESTESSHSSNSSPILSYVDSIDDDDLTTSKNAIKYIDMMLNSGRRKDLYKYTDLLIQKIVMNLRKLEGKHYNEVLENYGSTFTVLLTLCNEKQFIKQFSEERLYETLEQLLLIISYYKFSGKDNEIYRKTVNTIILSILENSPKTPLLSGLLRMLGDTREPGGSMVSGKLNELCMKCLWKLNRAQTTWDGELDYAVIFSVIRKFLRGFPVPWWKFRSGDLSLRTVKTVLRTMVKLRGDHVLDDVGMDDECELPRYMSKLIKHMNLEDSAKPGRHEDMITSTAQTLMPSQAKELSDIFNDIALNSPGAIQKLNEFRRRNPLVDLHRILSTMSPAFLKYFLAITGDTEEEIGGTADANPTDDGDFSKEVGRMWGKLKSLQDRIDNLKDA